MAEVAEAPVVEAPQTATPISDAPSGLKAMKASFGRPAPSGGRTAPEAPAKGAKVDAATAAKPAAVAAEAVKQAETKVPEVKEAVAKQAETSTPEALTQEAKDFLKSASPKTQNRFWELLQKEREAHINKAVEERLKSAPPVVDPGLTEKLTATEKRAQELERQIEQVAVERSPQFRQQFIERPKELRANLEALVKPYEIGSSELFAALDEGPEGRKKLTELVESVGVLDRGEVANLIREYQKIGVDRDKVLSDHRSALKVIEDNDKKRVADFIAGRNKSRQDDMKAVVLPDMENQYGFAFTGEEGAAAKAKVFGNIEAFNAVDVESMNPRERGAMIASAFLARPLSEALKKAEARNMELEARLAEYDEADAPIGGRSTSAAPTEAPKSAFAKMREELGVR